MQLSRFVLLSVAALAAVATAGDHPIVKVIALLQDLSDKVKTEGQTEEVSYQAFVYWCKTSSAELADAIQEEKDTIDTLQSTIEGKTKEIELLKEDIGKLEDEIKDLQASDKSATSDDTARNKLYLEKETDLKSTIQAMKDAITALTTAATTTDAKLLLSQHKLAQSHVRDVFALIATVASAGEESTLMDFVGADPARVVKAAGDATKHVKKYSFKSSSVTELLKNLQMKFEDDLLEATKAETNAANAHALSKNARDATLKAAEDSKKQKETDLGDAQGALSAANGDLDDQQADLKADSGALDTTKDSCNMKKNEWDERTAIRSQELAAMDAAVKILAKVSGVRTEAPGNPVPPAAPVTLIQEARAVLKMDATPQTRAVELLRASAKTYRSKALERLATEISMHVPKQFQDVVNAIQKMIFRLKQEQTDEDNHKAWCDQEIEKTTTSQGDKKDKITELNAKIKEGNAKVVTLTTDVTAANTMVSDIKKFQKEATEIRQTGKHENDLAIKDAVAAQKAITNAISVLQTFYKSSGEVAKEPWEFIQAPVTLPKNPATWDSGYTAVADPTKASTGVVAVLTAVSGDFSKMEANTHAQEVSDQKEYDDTMKKNSIELARRAKESDMKGAQKKRLLAKITDQTAQKKHVSDELESTDQYYKDLGPACMDGDSTYDDRKAARAGEITALGEAQGILDTAFDAKPPAKTFLVKVNHH